MRLIPAFLLAAVSQLSVAQGFPAHPLKVIVPQAPGGGFDLVARTLAEPLGAALGQAFAKVAASPDVMTALQKRGARPLQISGPDAEAQLARDLERYIPLIRNAGISID